MFFECLKDDKYFQTMFPEIPKHEKFEFHKIEIDFQNDRLTLHLQTDLLPAKRAKKDEGKAATNSLIEINFFFISDLQLQQGRMIPQNLSLNCFDKKIIGRFANEETISFGFEMARLEKWEIYQR